MKAPMNVIDLLAILPYYVSIALVNSSDVGQLTEVRRIAQFFRIMRILRYVRNAYIHNGVQVQTLRIWKHIKNKYHCASNTLTLPIIIRTFILFAQDFTRKWTMETQNLEMKLKSNELICLTGFSSLPVTQWVCRVWGSP